MIMPGNFFHTKIMNNTMNTKLIAGLGNPETKYAGNRHNVGFMIVDSIAKKI